MNLSFRLEKEKEDQLNPFSRDILRINWREKVRDKKRVQQATETQDKA